MKKVKYTPEKWLMEATTHLKKKYGLDPNDMDLDLELAQEQIDRSVDPVEYINNQGERHDLDPINSNSWL